MDAEQGHEYMHGGGDDVDECIQENIIGFKI